MNVEKSRIDDVPQIHKLINYYAGRNEMLPRALSEIYENLRDVFVVRDEDHLVACAALHIYWSDMAEIRGVAVVEEKQGQHLGTQLVEACLHEARDLHISKVFCLTYKPAFFEKVGFYLAEKSELPRKIWAECYTCPKFPDCDEVALIYDLSKGRD